MVSGWPLLPFSLVDSASLNVELEPDAFESMATRLETTVVARRTGSDAVRLLRACVAALAVTTAPVRILTDRDVLPDS